MTRATLIYNPVAGRNPARRKAEVCAAADVLRRAEFKIDVKATTGPGSACDLARSAAQSGVDAVIVCGGDGTINEAVNGLALSRCSLAILPGGTANIAGRDLGLPLKPVAAARALIGARPRRIALGRATWRKAQPLPLLGFAAGFAVPAANDVNAPGVRYFLSVAGIGFDAYVVYRLGWDFKRAFGVGAYVWEALRQVRRYGFPPFICRMGHQTWQGSMALLQRTERYAGWLHLAAGSSILNPQMKLFLFQSGQPWRYFLYSAAVVLRRHVDLPDLRITDSWPVECQPDGAGKPIRVELDGELAGELPATFELVLDALTLLLPGRRRRDP